MRISANLIVKNESQFISYVLESIHQVVDEILILDNGSTDDTIEKIRSFQEKTNVPVTIYENSSMDFAFMRNFLMERSSGDWILIADGDEVFYTSGKYSIMNIKEYISKLQANINVIFINFFHFVGSFNHVGNGADNTEYISCRFIKNNRSVFWHYLDNKMIHETIAGNSNISHKAHYYYAHYGYCKSNRDIWMKGKNYSERGCPNYLYRPNDFPDWENLEVMPSILNELKVKLFTCQHPDVMKDFDFSKYRVDVRDLGNNLFEIANKHW